MKRVIASCIYVFFSVWCISAPGCAEETKEVSSDEIAGPRAVVSVEKAQTPGSMIYTLKNCSDTPVTMFILGTGEAPTMQSIAQNDPQEVRSPDGWVGRVVVIEETIFMQIVWEVSEPSAAIGAGEALGGFFLKLSESPPPKEPLFHVDGTPVESLDFSTAPYKVCFSDGTCITGKIEDGKCPDDSEEGMGERHGD